MSKLQMALHAMPPKSVVTTLSFSSNNEVNGAIDTEMQEEVFAAKQLQETTGCTWAEAIRSVTEPSLQS
jgi:hypothetical protein